MTQELEITRASMRTPHAAAVAGIAFALLLGTALVLVRLAVPSDPQDGGEWLHDGWRRNAVRISLNLIPFAGLAFLWFIGVIRDRIGAAEDRLFATVFLGTGLLFVAMLFVAGALAGGLLDSAADQAGQASPELWRFGRSTTYQVLAIYAMRMAGAFTIVTTSIGFRLGIFPRWLVALGGLVGLMLLVAVESLAWAEILFPIWVLILSVYLLVHPPSASEIDAAT